MVDTVSPELRAAVDASVSWYDALCAVHQVGCSSQDDVWRAHTPPPPLHTAAKTLEPSVRLDRALAAVQHLDGGGIADSFGTLDLTAAGFRLLFTAQWIHRPAATLPTRQLPTDWVIVRSAPDLAAWTARHDTAAVLLPALLDRSSFCVLGRRDGAGFTAGAVLHLGTGVVDVSNVWCTHDDLDWTELVTAAAALFPGRPLVGYEHGSDLERAVEAGFTTLGPQRVWVR